MCELQLIEAVHPSIRGCGTLGGRTGKLDAGAAVVESRPTEPTADPGDLVLPDDIYRKWQLFKL